VESGELVLKQIGSGKNSRDDQANIVWKNGSICSVPFCLLIWVPIVVQPTLVSLKSGNLVVCSILSTNLGFYCRAAILGFCERLGEQAESGQSGHSVLTPEQRAFFATPADPLVLDGPLVYGSMPEHKLLQLLRQHKRTVSRAKNETLVY
jgi:hypothetical protein